MLLGLAVAVVLAITVAIWLARISPLEPRVGHADPRPSGAESAEASGRCVLCNAPLPRATLEELIAEIERRIDSDAAALPWLSSPQRSTTDVSGSRP